MAGTLNIAEFNKEILSNKNVIKAMDDYAKKLIDEAREDMINDFNSHPVTREIEAGENASNESGTLTGYGNLFSFIGFDRGSNPIQQVRELFKKIQISKSRKIDGTRVTYDFNMPSDQEIRAITKMPWENGRSWFFDIEKTISGIGYYLFQQSNKSRSGTAVQTQNQIRTSTFSPIKYFSKIKENFKRKINYR